MSRLALPLLCIVLIAGCSREEPAPLRLGGSLWPGYEPFYVARERGYWRDDQVRLVEYASSSELIRAFENGAIDAGSCTLDEALLLAEEVPDIRLVLVTDVSNGADVILAKPEFRTIADLKGHRIGTETTALGAYMLMRALQIGGLAREDVVVVPLEASEHESAFLQGTVDAVVTYEPTRTRLLKAGARKLFDSSQIRGEIVDVVVVRGAYLRANTDAVRLLLRAFYRGRRYFDDNPRDALRIAAARENVTPEEFSASLRLLLLPDANGSREMLMGTSPAELKNAHSLSEMMTGQELLTKAVDVDSLFDDAMLRRILP
jgi:NitT/TauT family transport system substrate-binding protein